jgi:hypothetical protein
VRPLTICFIPVQAWVELVISSCYLDMRRE